MRERGLETERDWRQIKIGTRVMVSDFYPAAHFMDAHDEIFYDLV